MAKVISFFKPQSSCKTNIDNLKEVLSTSSEEERASSNRIVSIMREWTSAVFNQINREHFSAGHTKVVFEYDDKVFAPNQITSTSPKKIVNAILLDYKELIALPDAEFEDAMNRIYSRLCKITYLTPMKGNIFQLHSPTWGLYVGDSIANMYTNITTGTKYLCDNCISFWIDM